MKKIDVCLTPDLIEQHDLSNAIVVVADIFRATSCMVSGLASGVASITPVLTVEECQALQAQGYLAGGERHAQMIEGFDLDNSPFSYMKEEYKGKRIAMTTTNGTLSITRAKPTAVQILAASFLNISAIEKYLLSQPFDVLVICAGWKGRPNLEDTLFAGALAQRLKAEGYESTEDSTLLAVTAFQASQDDMLGFLENASHLRRLKNLSSGEDIPFCLEFDRFDIVPIIKGDDLVLLK
ncbi:2-phosphosulfolactate phosphatase [Spirosomataceae bacterium TFI 002]|nr:2-phosphosulfolactate phosphatase [Spirosomataceae bacterium TFI 002]